MKKIVGVILPVLLCAVMLFGCRENHEALKNGSSSLLTGQSMSSANSAQSSADDIPTANSFYSTIGVVSVTKPSVVEEFYDGAFKLTKVYVTAVNENSVYCSGDALFGVVGADGNTIAKCIYSNVRVLSKNRVYVELDHGSRARIYNDKGNIISAGQYHDIYYWTDPKTGKYSSVGVGSEIHPDDDDKPCCLVDFDGKKIIPTNFVSMKLNDDKKTITVDDGEKKYVIDLKGNPVV